MNKQPSTEKLSAFLLTMLIVGSIDSIRNLPTTALFGNALIFFLLLSAVLFLFPTALVSAQLASTWSNKAGGIYTWVKDALGEKFALLAIWLQWINTVVWFPTILSFIAGIAAYLINPALAQNKIFLVSVILVSFWGLTFINLFGLKTSAKFVTACTLFGVLLPIVIIIAIGAIWFGSEHTNHIQLSANQFIPKFDSVSSWISLTAIMTAFLGIELASVHVKDVQKPQKNFPIAMLASAIIILVTMLLGSLAIALVLPHDDIQLVDGVMQAFNRFFATYHLSSVTPIIGLMLLLGSLGELVNWIISPAKGLLKAGENGYLPKWLLATNKHDIPHRLLFLQATIVSFIVLLFLFFPSINGSYWLLTDLSTQLYMLMYVLMFIAAMVLYSKHKAKHQQASFVIPGGSKMFYATCIIGMIGCALTLFVGFIPPAGIDFGSNVHYATLFACSLLLLTAPVGLLYFYRAKQKDVLAV